MYKRNVNKLKREKVYRVVHPSCFIVRWFFLSSFAFSCARVTECVGVGGCVRFCGALSSWGSGC